MSAGSNDPGAPPRVFLLSGWGSLPDGLYFPQLAAWLEARGCRVVRFPERVKDGEIDRHLATLDALVEANGGWADAAFVGQSIGAQTVLRALARRPATPQVRGFAAIGGWLAIAEPWPELVPWCDRRTLDVASVAACCPRLGVLLGRRDEITKMDDAQVGLWLDAFPDVELFVTADRGHYIVDRLDPAELAFIGRTLGL